ncbi:6987_t:CDS:1, partial [Paraglomus occultum]
AIKQSLIPLVTENCHPRQSVAIHPLQQSSAELIPGIKKNCASTTKLSHPGAWGAEQHGSLHSVFVSVHFLVSTQSPSPKPLPALQLFFMRISLSQSQVRTGVGKAVQEVETVVVVVCVIVVVEHFRASAMILDASNTDR